MFSVWYLPQVIISQRIIFGVFVSLTLVFFFLLPQELKLIGLDIPHFAADLPMNRCKNRYTNILPCKYNIYRLLRKSLERERKVLIRELEKEDSFSE